MKASKLTLTYLQCGEGFLAERDWVSSIACASAVLMTEPENKDAQRLFERAVEFHRQHPDKKPDITSIRLKTLRRFKDQLDRNRENFIKFEVSPELFRGQNEINKSCMVSEILARDILLFKRSIEKEKSLSDTELIDWSTNLINRLNINPSAYQITDGPDDEIEYLWLGVDKRLHNLGNDFYREEHFELSIECYDRVLNLSPDSGETLFNRGLARIRLRRYKEAHEDMSRFIEIHPDMADGIYTKGLIFEYQDQFDKAKECYEKAASMGYEKANTQKRELEAKVQKTSTVDNRNRESAQIDSRRFIVKPDPDTHMGLEYIGGHPEIKKLFKRISNFFNSQDNAFRHYGVHPPRGVLLEGPPGVGKTHAAKALASEARCNFYAFGPGDLLDMWYGNTSQNIRNLFIEIEFNEPAIVMIDEIDAFLSRRTSLRDPSGDECHIRTVAQFLNYMDGLKSNNKRIVILGATNRLDNLDPAATRAGRFSYIIHLGPPNKAELVSIWLIQMDIAQQRAERVPLFSPKINEAILSDREKWLNEVRRGVINAEHPILQLAELSHKKSLVGADIAEIIRRVVENKADEEITMQIDSGEITFEEILYVLQNYKAFKSEN
jgi:SpoVK/Ycf46/Vps4 family AAA+-type ATPase